MAHYYSSVLAYVSAIIELKKTAQKYSFQIHIEENIFGAQKKCFFFKKKQKIKKQVFF